MLPVASSSGFAIISVAVLVAVLVVWWLLRAEARDEAAEKETDEQVGRER
jgi:cbb3-type cytochrome oxidase subunit 3